MQKCELQIAREYTDEEDRLGEGIAEHQEGADEKSKGIFFFFKQKTAYEIGTGEFRRVLFRSRARSTLHDAGEQLRYCAGSTPRYKGSSSYLRYRRRCL